MKKLENAGVNAMGLVLFVALTIGLPGIAVDVGFGLPDRASNWLLKLGSVCVVLFCLGLAAAIIGSAFSDKNANTKNKG